MTEPITFLERAGRGIGSPGTAAVKDAAGRMAHRRVEAAAEYPRFEELRDHARRIRLHTLANLRTYLSQFADQVEARGGTVHWAADAGEATDVVQRLARDRGVHLIAKAKSMVTEEIQLNRALERSDCEVVETDLGEFIAQLAGDHPSHIIVPVLHMTRQSIGQLFTERLGTPFTDDPSELTAVARQHLRNVFLRADMGISGVNFGVAETGTICLVTNEGNGRFVTTAPRVHVAVMGMERLVPTAADLTIMLDLLARSATGQRLSTYTSLITGPRRVGDPDGPDELHLVIVDNGRTRALASEVAEILACIRCGACLNVCPVYREAGGHAYGSTYPGPLGAVLTPALSGLERACDLPFASSLCGACLEVCPIRIDLPEMLLTLRSQAAESGHTTPSVRRGLQWYASAATHPLLFRAALRMAGLLRRGGRGDSMWIKSLPGPARGWTDHRDLRRPAQRSFHDRWRKHNLES